MKIIHTSDWHIGRILYGRKRYEEFEAFLAWLAELIEAQAVEALLIAGDIFDTSTPSNRAQQLYYRFLCRIATSDCRHVVVIGGNHDSPTFLNAPQELLKALDIHVVGSMAEDPSDEVLVLRDRQGAPELIVCAVPYLRDRDIRIAEAGESIQDKERKLVEGIESHYSSVVAIAEERRAELGGSIPIVGMGHLFAAGGQTVEGDGVRDLYVGSLAHVGSGIFPESIDYMALGHLHVPQVVAGKDTIRYSGSPLPMGFGEARQQKMVCQIEFTGTVASVEAVNVPTFQKLIQIRGDWEAISNELNALSATGTAGWLEIIYEGDEVIADLRERMEEIIAESALEILRVKNTRIINRVLEQVDENETLDDIDLSDVFERCLAAHQIPEEQRDELRQVYQETLASLYEEGVQAE